MLRHEQGLTDQYLYRVRALAVRAEHGQEVSSEIEIVVRQAVEHFLAVKTSDPFSNLSAFRRDLSWAADHTHESQPNYRKTLLFALQICPDKL